MLQKYEKLINYTIFIQKNKKPKKGCPYFEQPNYYISTESYGQL